MKFETLKKFCSKKNIIIGFFAVAAISAIIFNFTRAKYHLTQNMPIVNGANNYKLSDSNVVAMYQENDNGEYVSIDTVPDSGYVLSDEKSYCEVNGEKDDSITINYNDGIVNIGVKKKGTKCYLYFDEYGLTMQKILAGYNKSTRTDFSTTVTASSTKTVYSATDWTNKTSYYFAGNPTDNWVSFGGFYWRIVRMNGDGSTRLIYNGTSTATTGDGTLTHTSQEFNTDYNKSYYVGLSYSTTQHGTGTPSDILKKLDEWYQWYQSNLASYAGKIDSNIGFCSDRNMASGSSWSAQPSRTIYYAAYDRIVKSQSSVNPSLGCDSSDILKIPIGLITIDETSFAGLSWFANNNSNYLYNNKDYWTMSPSSFNGSIADVFRVNSAGNLNGKGVILTYGVRPVINLMADVKFTGSGTTSDPFTVSS